MKRLAALLAGAAMALACATDGWATTPVPTSAQTATGGSVPVQAVTCVDAAGNFVRCDSNGSSVVLLTNASASGSPVGGVVGATYVWSCVGTFGGATLTLKALGPDGATYLTVDTMTSASSKGDVIGNNATVEVIVTGGSPSGLYCSLS